MALVLVLAAGLRLCQLDGQSLWADEGNSVVLARQPAAAIIAAAAADIHPPAYYLLLKAWGAAAGLGETGARSLSVLLGVLVVAVVYALGVRLRGSRLGLAAAVLAAVNPFLIYYSQEARMYMLLALCASGAALSMLALQRSSAHGARSAVRPALLYAAAAGLGLYTHYAFAIMLLALNIVFLLWLWHFRRPYGQVLAPWLAANAAAALLFLPWAPVAYRQLSTWPSPPSPMGLLEALRQAFELFTCGPVGCPPAAPAYAIGAAASVALIAIALIPWRGLTGLWMSRVLPLTWLLAPLAVMVIFRIFSPVFFKFLVIAAPAWVLLVALGIENAMAGYRLQMAGRNSNLHSTALSRLLPPALAVLLVGGAALPSLAALDRYYHDPSYARDDYRGLAAYLKALAGPDDAVLLTAPGQLDVFSQYDHGPAEVYPLPAERPLDAVATVAALDRLLASHRRLYAIYWAAGQADPDGVIESYLAQRAFKAWDAWTGNLRFVAYSAEQPPAAEPFMEPPLFGGATAAGEALLLEASGASAEPLQPGDIARTMLVWSAPQPLAQAYKVTLQLLDPANQVVAQVDSEPVGGTRPTTTWSPAETIADPYGLPIPLGTPPGDYTLILAVYDPATGARLPVTTVEGVGDHLRLGTVTITPPGSPPPTGILPVRDRGETTRGPLTFLGHDRFKQGFGHAPDTALRPGDLLRLTTFWRADAPPEGDYSFDLLLDGRSIGRFPLAGPTYPTSRWAIGFPWRGEATAGLPADLTAGDHALALQLIAPSGDPSGDSIPLLPELVSER